VKKIVFIVVLFMLFKPVMPVIDYIVNYQYISKVLCVNQAKPAMHCNGKCHLMKELAKASESEKSNSTDKKNMQQESEVLFFEEIKPYSVLTDSYGNLKKANYSYTNLYSHSGSRSVFHPPTQIS